ncbi:chloride channel CLIC-like protein 1 isoform X2 [Myxocyprinus asiaticus]|uniref:chloride channel CLIC-like protein 1 isoform X2 n=1 Tax=Myxocyprinus asiaticus TaxID=70543 RepID=UPI0022218FE4|nr:chloride channel CLIC-like protein 1 isoform X2 [Myxocyprinus asiaticus]
MVLTKTRQSSVPESSSNFTCWECFSVIMKVSSCLLFGFWSFFVFSGLSVIAYANIDHNDEVWTDKCDPTKGDEHKKSGTTTCQQPSCLPPDDAKTVMHYDAEVKLSKQSVAEIQKLLNDKNSWTTGAMDEALSQILVNFKLHDYEAWKWRFEDTFHVDLDTFMKILLSVLIIFLIKWIVWSWVFQFKEWFTLCFLISIIWNWFYLYMLDFSEHQNNIVQMESFNEKCSGVKQMDWKDSLSEWYRSTWTLQDDPCKKYYEVLLVNPILRVPPTKAITVTITSFMTDPLKQIGQGINEFIRASLKDLPVTLQIPVLVLMALAIVAFLYGSTRASMQHALREPILKAVANGGGEGRQWIDSRVPQS